MWSAWFRRLKALLVAATFAEPSEFEAAREVAYGKERLRNNLLILRN